MKYVTVCFGKERSGLEPKTKFSTHVLFVSRGEEVILM